MTPVRGHRSKFIHLTADARNLLCGKRVKQMIVEPDAKATCEQCLMISTTN